MPSETQKSEPPQGVSYEHASYELLILFLSVYALGVVVLAMILPVRQSTREVLIIVDNMIVFVFLYDFFRLLYRAPQKLQYLKWGWMDLISSLPGFYYLRLFRIGRILRARSRLKRETGRSVWEAYKANRAESALLTSFVAIFTLLIVTSILVLNMESRSPAADITSAEDAVWWSFVTLTTVGYGDVVPETTEGRIVGFILMAGGMVLLAIFTGYAASVFNPNSGVELEILGELREEVAELKQMLQEKQKEGNIEKE